MSETESTDVPETVDSLTPETFSFINTLAEVDYPTDEVEIVMDEKATIELKRILDKLKDVPEDDIDTMEAFLNDAKYWQDRRDASIHIFRLSGVSDDTISDLQDVAAAKFESLRKPRKGVTGQLERVLPESENKNYARYFNALVLSVHIHQIERADGAILTAPSAEEVAVFIDKGPTAEKEKLQRAIGALRARSEDFERRIDVGFLAKR
jgi:hypothetical protein